MCSVDEFELAAKQLAVPMNTVAAAPKSQIDRLAELVDATSGLIGHLESILAPVSVPNPMMDKIPLDRHIMSINDFVYATNNRLSSLIDSLVV